MARWDGVERRIEERRKAQIQPYQAYPKWVDGSLVESEAHHAALKKSKADHARSASAEAKQATKDTAEKADADRAATQQADTDAAEKADVLDQWEKSDAAYLKKQTKGR